MPDLDYAKVIGRFGLTVADGPVDLDDEPDIIWCNAGEIHIKPLTTYLAAAGVDPVPATLGQSVYVCSLDADGYLTFNGKKSVYVVDLTSDKVNPQIGANKATHEIRFVDVSADGTPVKFETRNVRITKAGLGEPDVNGYGLNDITLLSPVAASPAQPIYRGETGTGIQTLEIEGANLKVTLDDGTEIDAGELPAGPGGSNAGVAGYIETDGPTKAALSASIASGVQDDAESPTGVITARAASPRDTQRVKVERRPVLALDQVFPNLYVDHKIVWVHGDSTLYGIGKDDSLRISTDSGITWGSKRSYAGGLGSWAKNGGFLRLANGNLLTTYHPYDLSAPKIVRSTDDGATWTDVVAAQTNVDYLGPTSLCQDSVTGYVYATEYVTATAATKATWKIIRSTDNGGTWSTFHTFQRDAAANPTTAARHGHGIQWDPVSQRIYFTVGDGEQSAGLWRVNGAGADVEAVVTNTMVGMDTSKSPDMVGVMFFPNYIAWGVDRVSDSWLVRMARTQIGNPTPIVEKVARLQSTGFYCVRTASDNTEWILTVSNENGGGGRVDNLAHLYRVADDAATIDELASESVASSTAFAWGVPVGDPLKTHSHNLFWLGSNVPSLANKAPGGHGGWQASARLGWGAGQAQVNPSAAGRPFYVPVTAASGNQDLIASQGKFFGVTEAPPRTARLYILEVTREQFSGTGLAYVEVYDQTGAAVLKMEDGTTDMQWQNRSRRAALNENTAPYLCRSAVTSPGRQIRFRVREVAGNAAEVAATVTYAWGF